MFYEIKIEHVTDDDGRQVMTIYNIILQRTKTPNSSYRARVVVFNAAFNNISIISLWSVLLVKET